MLGLELMSMNSHRGMQLQQSSSSLGGLAGMTGKSRTPVINAWRRFQFIYVVTRDCIAPAMEAPMAAAGLDLLDLTVCEFFLSKSCLWAKVAHVHSILK